MSYFKQKNCNLLKNTWTTATIKGELWEISTKLILFRKIFVSLCWILHRGPDNASSWTI